MRSRLLRVLLGILLVPVAPASATVYLPADFDEMVATSVFILHGSVSNVRAETISDRRGIVTYVTVDVVAGLKGDPRAAVTFLVPGGQLGRYERVVVGAPQFTRGDEVILFLTSRGPSIPYIFGLSQGVYRISRASGSPMVLPPAVLAAGAEKSGRIVRGDPARRPLSLDVFTREVRTRVSGSRTGSVAEQQ